MPQKGLCQQIQSAMSADQVTALVRQGMEEYDFAHSKTVRRWYRLATRRKEQLQKIGR